MDFNHRPPGPALGAQWTFAFCKLLILKDWSGRMDLNHRPPGPEPGALARLRYAPTVKRSVRLKLRTQISTALHPRLYEACPVCPVSSRVVFFLRRSCDSAVDRLWTVVLTDGPQITHYSWWKWHADA